MKTTLSISAPEHADARAVRARFSAAALRYEEHAGVQDRVSAHLADRLAGTARPTRILDIGCGTGMLTRRLAAIFPDSRITALDFAPGMLARARSGWPEARAVEWVEADIRGYRPGKPFDLAVSGSCLQWVRPLHDGLASIHDLLAPGGRFLMAIMLRDTLHELRAARHMAVPGKPPGLVFDRLEDVTSSCRGFDWEIVHAEEKVYTQTYASAHDLLLALHHQGVTGGPVARSGTPLNRHDLIALQAAYERQYRGEDGVIASFHIGYVELLRRQVDP